MQLVSSELDGDHRDVQDAMRLNFAILIASLTGGCGGGVLSERDRSEGGDASVETSIAADAALAEDTCCAAEVDAIPPPITAAVTFTPPPGTYACRPEPLRVAMRSTTPSAAIYFTADDTVPSATSERYVAPITVPYGAHFRARARS